MHTQFSQTVLRPTRFQAQVLYFLYAHLYTHRGAINDPLTMDYRGILSSLILAQVQ